MDERQPFTAPVGVESGSVERALLEEFEVRRPVRGVVATRADELVDVLVPLVITGVHRNPAVLGERDEGALVLETAEGRVLDRLALGIEWVDLDDPAEAVRLVRVPCGVESLVVLVPPVSATL